ncbi:NAD(P)H-binding protein [Flavobacterium rakeshii]|uniref:NAD(P)H-binding protein n=1 Tax=Flavobacterium rakeshii TaxID=1038845 RepID=A0A6N8HDK0_9FLAO|nr:NAD(P)H-binding protein [Flavobacterium rakeshii]MEE1898862.1 NAD(P)H-binding protein [Flavobacterium rakeshii]MUV04130.1 NAD(P)H-binding protein [Flavobacterium rakeshii]
MKIAIIGATGFLGSNLVKEFTSRNHEVTAIVRNPKEDIAGVTWKKTDIFDTEALAEALKGSDAVVNAYNPGWTNPNIYDDFIKGSQSIQEAVKKSGVKRFITIGGAGSLYIAPNLQLVDTPEFPEDYKAGATAARDYLNILRDEKELDWAFFSPAIEMHQGIDTGRTGNYRLGLENPVFNDDKRSILSGEDVAVVIADEAENPKHHQQRFTAAY